MNPVVPHPSRSDTLLQSVKQYGVLLRMLPFRTPADTSVSHCWLASLVPICGALSAARFSTCRFTAINTEGLLIEPYGFDMSPCISIFVSLSFCCLHTAAIIASAPSCTLNPTNLVCIRATTRSATWSTAIGSLSFVGGSCKAFGLGFVFVVPSTFLM